LAAIVSRNVCRASCLGRQPSSRRAFPRCGQTLRSVHFEDYVIAY
jgi:hypothetical protein